jgi:hypothetical protein
LRQAYTKLPMVYDSGIILAYFRQKVKLFFLLFSYPLFPYMWLNEDLL